MKKGVREKKTQNAVTLQKIHLFSLTTKNNPQTTTKNKESQKKEVLGEVGPEAKQKKECMLSKNAFQLVEGFSETPKAQEKNLKIGISANLKTPRLDQKNERIL